MPELIGFSHVSLSVRDADASARWYSDVLGFRVFEELKEHEYQERIMVHASGAILCLQQHWANRGETFDPTRTGGDHVAFRVGSRPELDAWCDRFSELHVTHTATVDRDYGSVVCFRDPDDIQLELFYRENHP